MDTPTSVRTIGYQNNSLNVRWVYNFISWQQVGRVVFNGYDTRAVPGTCISFLINDTQFIKPLQDMLCDILSTPIFATTLVPRTNFDKYW